MQSNKFPAAKKTNQQSQWVTNIRPWPDPCASNFPAGFTTSPRVVTGRREVIYLSNADYHAVPTNARSIVAFGYQVKNLWRRTRRRRSQNDGLTFDRMGEIAAAYLPAPRILHPLAQHKICRQSNTQGGSRVCELRMLGSVLLAPIQI